MLISRDYGSDEKIVFKLGPGDTFGNTALDEREQKSFASAWCTKKCTVLVVNQKVYKEFIRSISYRVVMKKISFLKSIPVFSHFPKLKIIEPYFKDEFKSIY